MAAHQYVPWSGVMVGNVFTDRLGGRRGLPEAIPARAEPDTLL